MEYLKNLVEYYDELYPVSDSQRDFYNDLINLYPRPVKILRTHCATGYFEHSLAKEGLDVTGIEQNKDLIRSANLRRRNQLMTVRFFEMSSLDMARFLGKNFYNIISSLESRICFIHGPILIKKFFHDCVQLLSSKGVLVLKLINFEKYGSLEKVKLSTRHSIRSKLDTELLIDKKGTSIVNQKIETGNGKYLPVLEDIPFYPLTADEIFQFGKDTGFKKIEFYADFDKSPFTGKEDEVLAILKI